MCGSVLLPRRGSATLCRVFGYEPLQLLNYTTTTPLPPPPPPSWTLPLLRWPRRVRRGRGFCRSDREGAHCHILEIVAPQQRRATTRNVSSIFISLFFFLPIYTEKFTRILINFRANSLHACASDNFMIVELSSEIENCFATHDLVFFFLALSIWWYENVYREFYNFSDVGWYKWHFVYVCRRLVLCDDFFKWIIIAVIVYDACVCVFIGNTLTLL